MRCSTWRGNDLTKLNRQVQLWVCPRFEPPTPHLCKSYTGKMPVYLISFIPSASCRSNSFTILSPSPLLGVETPQQFQASSDRSRISTKACSPITCVTGCTTKSQRRKDLWDKFVGKCLKNSRFAPWFPLKDRLRPTRGGGGEKYLESFARCDRLRNSPIHYMRRRLNGKEGKEYKEKDTESKDPSTNMDSFFASFSYLPTARLIFDLFPPSLCRRFSSFYCFLLAYY